MSDLLNFCQEQIVDNSVDEHILYWSSGYPGDWACLNPGFHNTISATPGCPAQPILCANISSSVRWVSQFSATHQMTVIHDLNTSAGAEGQAGRCGFQER